MTEKTKTATLVRLVDGGLVGRSQAIYKLDPPVTYDDWEEGEDGSYTEVEHETAYVFVSAIHVPALGRSETYIFPCDEDGEVLRWGELEGSMSGVFSHETVLNGLGYTIA